MSYFTQMAGYAVHNFVSAATGMAIAIALVRGLARRSASTVGNFWVDLVRSTLYVLLPISIVFALVLVWQGVPQNFNEYTQVPDARRRDPDHRPGTGGEPGDHQGAGHQRGRLLQRQLGPPLREPEPASPTSWRCWPILAHPGRAALHLRPDGGRHPAGLGAVGRHGGDPRRSGSPWR